MIEKYTYGPFTQSFQSTFQRADLEILGINTFRPSYTAFIFFNDDDVNEDSWSEERETYAGQFSVFGHGDCLGDEGHCDVPDGRRRFDDRPSHPLTPAFRRVVVTAGLRRAIEHGADLTVTIIASCEGDSHEGERLLEMSGLQIVTFA